MSRVDVLAAAGGSYSVKFLEFTRIVSKNSSYIVCIFEGEDGKYFYQRIDDNLNPYEWRAINAGGKKSVLELYDAITNHPHYRSSRFLCFIDRDFECWYENPDVSRIYITPCYSIENLYLSESCFRKVLECEFGVTEFDEGSAEDFEQCIDLFDTLKASFSSHISQFNFWVNAHRIMERDSSSVTKLNVRNVKLNDLVSVSFSGVLRVYDIENPASAFKDSVNLAICPSAMQEAQESLSLQDPVLAYRGKQWIDFLRYVLILLKTDRTCKDPQFFSKKGPVKLTLSKENIISELSQYADTPECLSGFIRSYRESIAA